MFYLFRPCTLLVHSWILSYLFSNSLLYPFRVCKFLCNSAVVGCYLKMSSIHPSIHPNSLNSYFTAIGPKLASEFFPGANNIVPEDYLTKIKSSFTLKEVKPAIVLELLNAVKISKATGHDGISNRILK